MRCLYCGKELALFKRLRGGEFCSDAHRQRYQEEYTQLALNRLLQANTPKESENPPVANAKDGRAAEPESPALKRREKAGREELPSAPPPLTPAPANISAQHTAVLEPEAAPAPVFASAPAAGREPGAVREPAAVREVEEPAPAGMSGFLVEVPVPLVVGAPAPAGESAQLLPTPVPELPRLREFRPDLDSARLDPAERITLSLFTVADFPTPLKERGLELREFVRGVPQVEIHVKPAVDSGFEPVREALEVDLSAHAPQVPARLWVAPELDMTADLAKAEILLGELARLDFALTEWGEAGAGTTPEEETESEPQPASPVLAARIETMLVEPVRHEPAPGASLRPEPLRFEPVHIDPVFMERIAGTTGFEGHPAEEVPAAAAELPEAAPIAPEPVAGQPVAPPATITRPLPVTLHGLAPLRGKPVQVFTAAVVRTGAVQIPRETGLPLRPVMVLGPAPKPASVELAAPPAQPVPVPEKSEPQKSEQRPEVKPRRSEVRVLPVQVKEVKPKPAETRPAPEAKPAEAAKSTAPAKPADAPKPIKTPVEIRPAAAEEIDSLGLPKLSFQQKETFWSRLPGVARLGVIAAVLALIVGGVVLTSRGSGSAKPPVPVPAEPVYVEEPALANTAGWEQDWFADRPGVKQSRHVDILRGSLTLRDYRLVFEGQIERGALGWVFRADANSFYVDKIQVTTPGREPVMALVHFAVINGVEQPRTQVPLPIQAYLDTLYKVRMDVVGNQFTTWVQDQKADQWSDNQLAVGGVGLYYENGDSAKLRDTLNVIPLRRK